jgi:hypothetical protein
MNPRIPEKLRFYNHLLRAAIAVYRIGKWVCGLNFAFGPQIFVELSVVFLASCACNNNAAVVSR